jgi:hypothetical protein
MTSAALSHAPFSKTRFRFPMKTNPNVPDLKSGLDEPTANGHKPRKVKEMARQKANRV